METPVNLKDIALGCSPTFVLFGQDTLFAAFTSTSGSLQCVRGTTNLGSQSGATKWDSFGTIAEKGGSPLFSVALTVRGSTLFSFFDPGDHTMHMACCDVFGSVEAKWEKQPNITTPGALFPQTCVCAFEYLGSEYVFFQTVSGALGVCRGVLGESGEWVSVDCSEFPYKIEGYWTAFTDKGHIFVLTSAGIAQSSGPDSDGVFHWTSKPHHIITRGSVNSVSYSPAQWMSSLGDNTPFCGLSIPGTHDSCTYKVKQDTKLIAAIGESIQRVQALFVKDPEYNKHDAFLYHLVDIVATQDKSIDEQLNDGIRFFDVRLGLYEDDGVGVLTKIRDYLEEKKAGNCVIDSLLQMAETLASVSRLGRTHANHLSTYHDCIPLGVSFDDVLSSIKVFLTEHPRECVVIFVRREHEPWSSNGKTDRSTLTAMFQDAYTNTIAEFSHKGIQFLNGAHLPATLAEARGKVVIVQDGPPIAGAGMNFALVPSPVEWKNPWTSQPGYKQDGWGVESGEDKWKALMDNIAVVQGHDLDPAENRRFVISFASGTCGDPTKGVFPKVVADYVQPLLRKFLQEEAKREHPRSVGVVALDYYDKDIPSLIAGCSNDVK